MRALLSWHSLRHWTAHPLRSALTLGAVALGVAAIVAIRLITTEITAANHRTLERIAGRSQLTVTRGPGGFEREVADRIAAVGGVAAVEVLLEQTLVEPGYGPVLLLGVDLLTDSGLRPVEAIAGDEAIVRDPIAFLNSRESVLVPERFAARRGLARGDSFTLQAHDGRHRFVVRGLLADEGIAAAFGGDVVVMYLDAAQVALGLGEKVTRVDVGVASGEDPTRVAERIGAVLEPGFAVEPPARRGAKLDAMMGALNQSLAMMGAIAILLAALLAFNAVEISVRQRRGELAIVRMLGAGRRTLTAVLLCEATLLGAVATAIGIPLGLVLAHIGLGATAAMVSSLFAVVRVDALQPTAAAIVPAAVMGLVVPAIAAFGPVRWVSRRPPLEGITRPVGDLDRGVGRRALLIGVAAMLAGLALFAARRGLPPSIAATAAGYGGFAVFWIGGLLSAAPIIAVAALRLRRYGRRLPVEMMLAVDYVVRDRRRATVNLVALVVCVATVSTFGIYIHSFRTTYEAWLQAAVPADLIVNSGARLAITEHVPLDPSFAQELASIDGVGDVVSVQIHDMQHLGRWMKLLAVPSATYLRHARPLVLEGELDSEALASGAEVVVSENMARRFGYHTGAEITLDTPTGPLRLRVQAVIVDFTSDQGLMFIDRATYLAHFGDPLVDSFYVFAAPGADVQSLRAAILDAHGEAYDLHVLSGAEFRAEGQKLIDAFFALLFLLQGLTVVIAVLGVATTALTTVIDRQAELGVLRIVAASRAQVTRIILFEAGFLGGAAACAGILIGAVSGWMFLTSVGVDSTGWALPFRFPALTLAAIVATVTLASAAAAVQPALWVTRRSPLLALRRD